MTRYIDTKDLPSTIKAALAELGFHKRKIQLLVSETYTVGLWPSGDGARTFTCAVDIGSGETKTVYGSWGGPNLFARSQADMDTARRPIPLGGAVITGEEGRGHPTMAEIIVHPATVTPLLDMAESTVTPEEWTSLRVLALYKPAYRQDAWREQGLGTLAPGCPIIQDLARRGLVKVSKTGSITITTKGTNTQNCRKPE